MALIHHRPNAFGPGRAKAADWRPDTSLRPRLSGLGAVVDAGPRLRWFDKRRVARMDAKRWRARDHRAMTHTAQDAIGLRAVVVDPLPVAPAIGGEIQRHGVILLAIGGGARAARSAVGAHRPGKIAERRVRRVGHLHIGLGPVPQRVELALVAQLHGDHHAVTHALGAGIVVGPVGDIGQRAVRIGAGLEIEPLLLPVAVEQLVVDRRDAGVGVGRGDAQLLG
jgi:hypothetical protein